MIIGRSNLNREFVLSVVMFYNYFMDFLYRIYNFKYFYQILSFFCLFLLIIQTLRLHKKHRQLRSDAIKRSKAVIGGQVLEQVAPFLPDFPCNPADARFIGKPVDFIAFSGLSEDKVSEVLLIEVKTGHSELSAREKEIRRAVKEGRVRYVEYRIN